MPQRRMVGETMRSGKVALEQRPAVRHRTRERVERADLDRDVEADFGREEGEVRIGQVDDHVSGVRSSTPER